MYVTTFLCHGPLTLQQESLLPLSPQNMLDRDNGKCRPTNRHIGDFGLIGNSYLFYFV